MIPWSFYRLGRQTLGKSRIAGYYLIVACEKYLRRVILGASAVLLLALFAPHPALAEPAADDTAANTTQWTYDEIVNDPEFQGYEYYIQFGILLMYFYDKGSIPYLSKLLVIYYPSASLVKYKFYSLPRGTHHEMHVILLLGSVLSPSIINALQSDLEFREFLCQYCRYYYPFIIADSKQPWGGYSEGFRIEGKDAVFRKYYIPDVTIPFIRLLSDLAPESCGYTTSNGSSVYDDEFVYVTYLEGQHEL